MPDEPRTLGEIIRDAREEAKLTDAGLLRGDFKDGFISALDEVDERFGDALIGAQGRVVYTAEDVERAARAMTEYLGVQFVWKSYDRLTASEREVVLEAARLALTAAGGVVMDCRYQAWHRRRFLGGCAGGRQALHQIRQRMRLRK